jgi:spore coat protein U-like protein
MKRSVQYIILTVALTLVSSSLFAQGSVSTTNANNVTAAVVGSCRWITPMTMAFGNYDPLAVPPTTASAGIQFKCVKRTNATDTYRIWFSKTAGNMVSGGDNLAYTLTNAGTGLALPTTAATAIAVAGTAGIGALAGYNFTVDGSVAAGQDVGVGAYQDTVVVTVEY